MTTKPFLDPNNPADLSTKVASEAETRQKFLTVARRAGRERDMLLLFAKFDKMMKNCDDESKRKDISKIGAVEIYKLLGECFASLKSAGNLHIEANIGELYVDGELVYKGKG